MPKGWCRSVAKTEICCGLPSAPTPRKTWILPASLSARNRSPLGATRMQARIVEAGGVELDLEALGRDGPRVGGAGNDVGAVVDGLIGSGRGQIGDGEMAAGAGRLVRASVNAACPVSTGWVPRPWRDWLYAGAPGGGLSAAQRRGRASRVRARSEEDDLSMRLMKLHGGVKLRMAARQTGQRAGSTAIQSGRTSAADGERQAVGAADTHFRCVWPSRLRVAAEEFGSAARPARSWTGKGWR